MPSLLVKLSRLEGWKFQIYVIFVVKTLKILTMFLKIAPLFKEFGILLNIIVQLLFFMKVTSSIDYKYFIRTLEVIIICLINQWKILIKFCGVFGIIKIKCFLRRFNQTPFSSLIKATSIYRNLLDYLMDSYHLHER